MAAITVQRPSITAATVTFASASGGGDTIKPGDGKNFRDTADGLVDITYSAVTSVTVAAVEV